MATNLALDPDLLDRALAVSGERTKKAAVTKALKEFIARREQKRLAELFGQLDWDPDYDYKSERSRGLASSSTPACGHSHCDGTPRLRLPRFQRWPAPWKPESPSTRRDWSCRSCSRAFGDREPSIGSSSDSPLSPS